MSQPKIARANKAPAIRVTPCPGTPRTFARPFPKLSGRRHVPVLVNANRVPFLRIKKPQPPFLSRIIRDTVETRERRLTREETLSKEAPIAEDEDEWDQILNQRFGLDSRDSLEQPWKHEVKQAFDENHKLQVAAIQKRADIAAKMYAIAEQEKVLAKEEKLRIRDEKHKARKARRLARRGWTESEIHAKLYPQIRETVTRDAPISTEEMPRPDQGEVRQSSTEQEWRKRGNKYKTSEELKQLYEASLRPKTDEEKANIKEARAKRKEEESNRKAQKLKRKQENIALWEQRLDNEAEGSTNKRLRADTYTEGHG